MRVRNVALLLSFVLAFVSLISAQSGNLSQAIDTGNVSEVERLIADGCDLDQRDSNKRTFLMRAVNFKQNEIVQVLVDGGANVDARDAMNQTALHYCAIAKNAGAVAILIRAGLDVDVCGFDSPSDGPSESTPLHFAAQSKALDVAAALIEAGANVNALTNVGDGKFRRSPLFWAEKSNDPAMANLLKEYGAVKFPEGATQN